MVESAIEPLPTTEVGTTILGHTTNEKAMEVKIKDNYHRILMLNVNSMNDTKFKYLANYMLEAKNCMIALTELVSETSELNNLLARDNRFPILSDNSCKRVGLMVPKYLHHCFEIIDTHNIKQFRKRKSQSVCQLTTFRFSYSKIVEVITVVYCAPDASQNSRKALRDKLLEYSHKFSNYIALGDFNSDFKLKTVRDEYKAELGGQLNQVVKEVTRQQMTKRGNKSSTSRTIIDLMFVSNNMKQNMVSSPIVYKDSPSDHFMVECAFNINAPKKYAIY